MTARISSRLPKSRPVNARRSAQHRFATRPQQQDSGRNIKFTSRKTRADARHNGIRMRAEKHFRQQVENV
jgi:hypothetical protein